MVKDVNNPELFKYEVETTKDAGIRLTLSMQIDDPKEAKSQLHIMLKPVKDDERKRKMQDLLTALVQREKTNFERINDLEGKLHIARSQFKEASDKMDSLQKDKEEMEAILFQKFAALLNSKKQEIRRLRDQLRDQEFLKPAPIIDQPPPSQTKGNNLDNGGDEEIDDEEDDDNGSPVAVKKELTRADSKGKSEEDGPLRLPSDPTAKGKTSLRTGGKRARLQPAPTSPTSGVTKSRTFGAGTASNLKRRDTRSHRAAPADSTPPAAQRHSPASGGKAAPSGDSDLMNFLE